MKNCKDWIDKKWKTSAKVIILLECCKIDTHKLKKKKDWNLESVYKHTHTRAHTLNIHNKQLF